MTVPPVYPITMPGRFARGHLGCALALLEGGARWIQVREKELPEEALFDQLVEIRRECRRAGARLIVNDRVELAAAADCDGAHVGQTDLPAAEARRILGADRLLGLSTHNRAQFAAAQQADVDYVAIGPIYPTASKPDAERPVGESELQRLVGLARRPVVAIGGITLKRAVRLWRLGVDAVAVIGDIAGSADPAARVRQYLQAHAGLEMSRT